MAKTDAWSGFDTDAHRSAQANCHHLIHCAVDARTRAAVSGNLDTARRTGDATALLILIAQLTGPCCLPPAQRPEPAATPPVSATNGPATGADPTRPAGPTQDRSSRRGSSRGHRRV